MINEKLSSSPYIFYKVHGGGFMVVVEVFWLGDGVVVEGCGRHGGGVVVVSWWLWKCFGLEERGMFFFMGHSGGFMAGKKEAWCGKVVGF